MSVPFDPSAIRAELRTEGDHWVVALELSTGGSWGHADATWTTSALSRQELAELIGDEALADEAQVVSGVEVTLRREGWRVERVGEPVTPPTLEVWDLSPAADYGRRHGL
jgi:hypothetical protein